MNKLVLIAFVATVVCVSIDALPVNPPHHIIVRPPRPVPRPDQHRLLLTQKAAALINLASKVVKFLETQHKQEEAKVILQDATLVRQLADELRYNPTAHSAHLTLVENQLTEVEARLESEIKNVQNGVPLHTGTEVHKRQLLDRASLLEKQAAQLIATLKSLKLDAETVAVENDEQMVKIFVHDLQTNVNVVQASVIEMLLGEAENRLALEMQKAQQYITEHEKQQLKQLLARATELHGQVETAIRFLKVHKRDLEAMIFETEEAVLKQLVVQLGKTTSVVVIEQQLEALETRMATELDKLHVDMKEAKDKVRIELLARATKMEQETEKAIKTLKAQNKTVEAGALEKDLLVTKNLAKQLETARGAALIVLEKQLGEAEARLALELAGVHH